MEPKERIIKAIEQWYIGTISWGQLDEQIDMALTLSTKKPKIPDRESLRNIGETR